MQHAGLTFEQVDKYRGYRIMSSDEYIGVIILFRNSPDRCWTSARDVLHAREVIDQKNEELNEKLS